MSMALPVLLFAQQQDSTRSAVRDDLEEALESFDPENLDQASEQLIQYLEELATNPININMASVDELLRVPGMDLKKARAIIAYRGQEKPFEKLSELIRVKGIGEVSFKEMQPYLTTGRGLAFNKLLYSNHRYWTAGGHLQVLSRYQQDLQQAEGYNLPADSGGYRGGPSKYYQRLGYESNHVSMNLTQEKDPGEVLGGPTNFDYRSWHVALQDNGHLRMLVGGDYSLSFGQGLVLWNGASFGKGGDVAGSVSKNGRGIDPYTSAQETNAYRGAAMTIGRRLQLTGFYSRRGLNASEISADSIRYPSGGGYHRTNNEWSKKNNVQQELYGGHLQMEFPFGIIGATAYQTAFDRYITPSDQLYAAYDFKGYLNSAFGMDYRLLLGPSIVFGEAARSENGGLGVISGIEAELGEQTDLSIAYRYYQPEFQSILGSGFSEISGAPKNEEGFYLGFRHVLADKVTFSAYMDQYRFPNPRFGTHQPTQGYDWLAKGEVTFSRQFNFYLQVRSESREEEYESLDLFGRTQRKLGRRLRSGYRANLEYWSNRSVRLRTRGELVQSRKAGEQTEWGYLIYQDIRLLIGDKLRLDARLTMFDTESYATRVYQFENDLLYVFASQALFNQGQRLYALLNYEPTEYLELWAKFGLIVYEDEQVIGSGLNQITGDQKSEVGVEVRVKF